MITYITCIFYFVLITLPDLAGTPQYCSLHQLLWVCNCIPLPQAKVVPLTKDYAPYYFQTINVFFTMFPTSK